MYQTCIFCSAKLGTNETIETFPVGKRIAFDAFKGRLWAICPKCARWNLAPIEERWEAVEEAEKAFRDSRLRVQSENIGMAKMRDGTYLVRVGSALPGELAAWRYGSQLVKRKRRSMYIIGAAAIGGVALVGGIPFLVSAGVPLGLFSQSANLFNIMYQRRTQERVLLRLNDVESDTGADLLVRGRDVSRMQFSEVNGAAAVTFAARRPKKPSKLMAKRTSKWYEGPASIVGPEAEQLAARVMVNRNSSGASRKNVDAALSLIDQIGSSHELILAVGRHNPYFVNAEFNSDKRRIITPHMLIAESRGTLPPRERSKPGSQMRLNGTTALALEMALHDESERVAMQGELAILEGAWREAEEIAHIADALPDEPS